MMIYHHYLMIKSDPFFFQKYADLGRESKKSLEGMSIQQVEQEIKKLFSG